MFLDFNNLVIQIYETDKRNNIVLERVPNPYP